MKKAKLFLSICTMCLCFAVLCMGIYAAQSVTYTISGTISYTVEDVFAEINTSVYKVAGQTTAENLQTNVDALAGTSFSTIAGSTTTTDATLTYVSAKTLDKIDTSTSLDKTTYTGDLENIVMGKGSDNVVYYTYYIVVNIKNLADRAINAHLTDTTTYTNLNKASKLVQNNIAKGETKNLVVAFSLADEKVEINSLSINYKVEVGYDMYYSKSFAANFLKEDATNGYYYTELGTLSDSSTPIRWRLVSLDGTSKYVYKANSIPTTHDGAIFIQETYLGSTVAFNTKESGNYYNSSIRTNINTLSTWNLQDSNVSSLITKRNITEIEDYESDGITRYTGTTSDYFWLMSVKEVSKYFGMYTYKIWKPDNSESAVGWWLRTTTATDDSRVCSVDKYGFVGHLYATSKGSYAVRAAFQLA